MKKTMLFMGAAALLMLTSCGGSKKGTPAGDTGKEAAVPTMTVNEADWEVKNLHDVSPLVNVSLKLPKTAKMEKNGNGGVDVMVNDFYTIEVSAPLAVGSLKEARDGDLSLTINKATTFKNGKLITDEPNGFVYSVQMNDEANGTTYQPEAHFVFYLESEGVINSIKDARPMGNFFVPGSAYSEAIAKQVYAIVKASATKN
jgi:hypothetical protein